MFEKRGYGKKGQVTIFIIIGVLVVAIVALFLILNKSGSKSEGSYSGDNPTSYISLCMKDNIEKSLASISLMGGSISNPLKFGYTLDGEKLNLTYLCYTEDKNLPCVIQQPSILNNMENEIEEEISADYKMCFDNFVDSLTKDGYEITDEYKNPKVDITDGNVLISSDAKITLSKGNLSQSYDNIIFEYPSEMYGIAKLAQKIISSEATGIQFNVYGYLLNHPEYNINEYKSESYVKVYDIKHKTTKERFVFAVKRGI